MTTKAERKEIVVAPVGGLEVETDPRLRAPNTWWRLENFDLQIPGSIRKAEGYQLFNANKYDSEIVAIREYRRAPGSQKRILGLSVKGVLYDLQTGDAIAQFPTVNYPFVGQMSALADGQSVDSGVNPATQIQYLVSTTAGYYPYKWNGLDGIAPTPIGVTAPSQCPTVKFLILARGYDLVGAATYDYIFVQVARHYAWTWWNPETLHESSLSPIGEDCVISPTRFPGLQQWPRIRQICVGIPTDSPPYGSGYTHKRIYATRDGGTEFFLLTGLPGMDVDGAIPLAQASILDGSFDPSVVTVDTRGTPSLAGYYVAVGMPSNAPYAASPGEVWVVVDTSPTEKVAPEYPTGTALGPPQPEGDFIKIGFGEATGPVTGDANVSPTIDDVLVQPSPTVSSNNPPPPATWGAIYQGRLWFVSADDESKLVFSNVNDFESFPADNYFLMDADDFDPIVSLQNQYTSLLVGKHQSLNQITGTSFADFTNLPLEPFKGTVGKRLITAAEGRLFFMSEQGVERLQSNIVSPDGHLIKPLTDLLDRNEAAERLCAAYDARRGVIVFAIRLVGAASDRLLYIDLSQQSPFSVTAELGCMIYSMQNVLVPGDNNETILAGTGNCEVVRLFTGGLNLDQKKPLDALAQTQLLPQEDPNNRKVFRRLIINPPDVEGMFYRWLVDPPIGTNLLANVQPWLQLPWLPLQHNNFLGTTGRQIVVQFKHDDELEFPSTKAMISSFIIEYVDIGESR